MDDLVFLGYRAKQPWAPDPEWAPIELICNVGEDLCEPPRNWVNRWDFNRGFCYATPEAAWATVEEDYDTFRLFAYFLLPVRLYDGKAPEPSSVDEILEGHFPNLPPPPVEMPGFVELGYDIAEHNFGFTGYAYSPLVTNGYAGEFPTNRYGLLDEFDVAVRACEVINDNMPEHAPHWIFQVFAKDLITQCALE